MPLILRANNNNNDYYKPEINKSFVIETSRASIESQEILKTEGLPERGVEKK